MSGGKSSAEKNTVGKTIGSGVPGWWSRWGFPIAWLAGLGVVVPAELERWNDAPVQLKTLAGWFIGMNLDTSVALVFLIFAPVCWFLRYGILVGRSDPMENFLSWGAGGRKAGEPRAVTRGFRAWGVGVALLSLGVNLWVGRDLQGLPPAYHDEYSYLFQARTYLDGKIAFPAPEGGEVFDQMHVLNRDRFASRYFPGTGMWMAPFVALDRPYWGHAIAGALCTWWIFWAGFEAGGSAVAILAGVLTACAPGMGLFGNLLLAHHPGLAGLSLFLYRFLRWMRTGSWGDACMSGCGLTFGMLCRPMTAAGFGLPFGLYYGWRMIRGFASDRRRSIGMLTSMGIPLMAGLGMTAVWNQQTTGDWRVSAYQAYTDYYTPRHVYGFNNVVRGEQALGDRVLPIVTQNYDTWAENLTPRLATWNVYLRGVVSWQWTVGIVPLLLVSVSAAPLLMKSSVAWRLIGGAIVSLHIVHVPYWFDGIMHWHYVFETGVLWVLLFAGGTCQLFAAWKGESRPWMGVWWGGLTVMSLLMMYVPLEPYWMSRVELGRQEVLFAKVRYAGFQQMLERLPQKPALLLVEHDPADRSMDYVSNEPSLTGEVLVGRFDPEKTNLKRLRELFPQRSFFIYHVKEQKLEQVGK